MSNTFWVSLLVDQRVPEDTCSHVLRSNSVDSEFFQSIIIFCVKIGWNCNFVGLFHHSSWLQLILAHLGHHFSTFENKLLLRIINECSVPEMRIWTILLIKFKSKWCLHLVEVSCLFQVLGDCYCWWTRESYDRLLWFIAFSEHHNFLNKICWNCYFVGLLHYPFWRQPVSTLLVHHVRASWFPC